LKFELKLKTRREKNDNFSRKIKKNEKMRNCNTKCGRNLFLRIC